MEQGLFFLPSSWNLTLWAALALTSHVRMVASRPADTSVAHEAGCGADAIAVIPT